MNHKELVGQTFLEMELHELLRFDIEADPKTYFGKHMHIYFDRHQDQKICVDEVRFFDDHDEFNQVLINSVTKREWIEIHNVGQSVKMSLCRLDRTGFITIVRPSGTHHEPWVFRWMAELPPEPPLTEEEIRLGFMELAGILIDETSKPQPKPKKAM